MKKKIKRRFSAVSRQARQALQKLFPMRVKIERAFLDMEERQNYIEALIKEFEEK